MSEYEERKEQTPSLLEDMDEEIQRMRNNVQNWDETVEDTRDILRFTPLLSSLQNRLSYETKTYNISRGVSRNRLVVKERINRFDIESLIDELEQQNRAKEERFQEMLASCKSKLLHLHLKATTRKNLGEG